MNALIGDIGNTITKICVIEINSFKILKTIYLNTNKIFSKNFLKKALKKIFKKKTIYRVALFSSVVPKYQKILENFLKKEYAIKLREIKEKNIKKIVKINIKNKNQVGSDRIANAVGVYKWYKSNCIVLDFGTATTFDVVTKNGIYNGGIIAPGDNHSLKRLVSAADQIPFFSITKQKKIIGKNTSFFKKQIRNNIPFTVSKNLQNAVNNICKDIKFTQDSKNTILLSPAAASFDQFSNFGSRGNYFKNLIRKKFKRDLNV